MLARLLTKATRPKPEAETPRPVVAVVFLPMKPVRPPRASNDDVLAKLVPMVERELRAAGYL